MQSPCLLTPKSFHQYMLGAKISIDGSLTSISLAGPSVRRVWCLWSDCCGKTTKTLLFRLFRGLYSWMKLDAVYRRWRSRSNCKYHASGERKGRGQENRQDQRDTGVVRKTPNWLSRVSYIIHVVRHRRPGRGVSQGGGCWAAPRRTRWGRRGRACSRVVASGWRTRGEAARRRWRRRHRGRRWHSCIGGGGSGVKCSSRRRGGKRGGRRGACRRRCRMRWELKRGQSGTRWRPERRLQRGKTRIRWPPATRTPPPPPTDDDEGTAKRLWTPR